MIKLTLEVTPQQLTAIALILQGSSEASTEPSAPLIQSPIEAFTISEKPSVESPKPSKKVPGKVTKPTAGKKVTMAAFGRSQKQIEDFEKNEQERFDNKSEEDLLKEERAAERAEKKALKDKEAKEKAEEKLRKEKEVAEIKLPTATGTPKEITKKPWEL